MSVAATLIWLVQAYAMIGGIVAALFLTIGMDRIDEDARGAYAFRPLLIPAILLIWPLVLWRWWREETGMAHAEARHSPPRRAHGVAALLLGLVIALTLAVSFTIRQTWPADAVPVRLDAPQGAEP
ncbi:hypothetical protein [Hasllibacter sp. MH4015]|uniref:hypothetical protein n=1 Tax=Hasllibacter sp. MH4015 TaxID=2854029 RepID=UPI001CD457E5|nr:hypothetical protein [Hasllibacter sp. MH4015]